jgi:ubiquitin-protein ligase
LCEFNLEDPLDTQVANHWKQSKTDAEVTAREWTQIQAGGQLNPPNFL